MAIYEYLTIRNIAGRRHGGEAVVKGMFRRPEPGESSAEMEKSKTWRGIRHPVHKSHINQAALQEATKEEEDKEVRA